MYLFLRGVQWSRCSQKSIRYFLSTSAAECLQNKPRYIENKVKEYRGQELYVTSPTRQRPCPDFLWVFENQLLTVKVKFKVSGIITLSDPYKTTGKMF